MCDFSSNQLQCIDDEFSYDKNSYYPLVRGYLRQQKSIGSDNYQLYSYVEKFKRDDGQWIYGRLSDGGNTHYNYEKDGNIYSTGLEIDSSSGENPYNATLTAKTQYTDGEKWSFNSSIDTGFYQADAIGNIESACGKFNNVFIVRQSRSDTLPSAGNLYAPGVGYIGRYDLESKSFLTEVNYIKFPDVEYGKRVLVDK